MARTRLDRYTNNPETHKKTVNAVIRGAMAREGVRFDKQLCGPLGLTQQQIFTRFDHLGWSSWELFQLNKLLHFTAAEGCKLLGVEP